MIRLLIASVAFLLYGAGCPNVPVQKPIAPPRPVACTMEAKLCPDGSAVGRTGPNCEFAPCPSTK